MTKRATKTKEAEPALFPQEPVKTEPKKVATKAPAKRQQTKNEVVPFKPKEQESTNLLLVFARAASDPKCDTQKMRELKDMMNELKRDEAEVAFTEAYVAMRAKLPKIDKDGLIDHGDGTSRTGRAKQKTRYSSYENIMQHVQPILNDHGFMLTCLPEPHPSGVGIRVRGTLARVHQTQYGKVVHKIESVIDAPPEPGGSKNAVQAIGSSLAYCKRYNVIALGGITSYYDKDRDDDARATSKKTTAPDTVTNEQQKKLIDAVRDCGIEPTRFFDKYKIERMADLPADKFDDAIKSCENYKAAAGAGAKSG